MANPGVRKVFHGAVYDIALLKRDYGFTFASLCDTEIAARFCGRVKFGLQALLESELGVQHPKSYQRFDWSRRPLSPAHERYLAGDVRHLLALAHRLEEELRTLGREAWAREECDALAAVPAAVPREPSEFMKAKGARDLTLHQLAVLRELFRLRETWAERRDKPPFMVVGDEALMALAVRSPARDAELAGIPGMPERLRTGKGTELLEAVRRGSSLPDEELPRWIPKPRRRQPRAWHGRVDRVKAWRAETAERVGLDPGFFLPARLIETLATAAPADADGLAAVPEIRRWRVDAFGREILSALGAATTG